MNSTQPVRGKRRNVSRSTRTTRSPAAGVAGRGAGGAVERADRGRRCRARPSRAARSCGPGSSRSKNLSIVSPSWSLSRLTGACTSRSGRPSLERRSQRFGKHTDPAPNTSPPSRSIITTRSSCTSRLAASSGCSEPSTPTSSPVRPLWTASPLRLEVLRPACHEVVDEHGEHLVAGRRRPRQGRRTRCRDARGAPSP